MCQFLWLKIYMHKGLGPHLWPQVCTHANVYTHLNPVYCSHICGKSQVCVWLRTRRRLWCVIWCALKLYNGQQGSWCCVMSREAMFVSWLHLEQFSALVPAEMSENSSSSVTDSHFLSAPFPHHPLRCILWDPQTRLITSILHPPSFLSAPSSSTAEVLHLFSISHSMPIIGLFVSSQVLLVCGHMNHKLLQRFIHQVVTLFI